MRRWSRLPVRSDSDSAKRAGIGHVGITVPDVDDAVAWYAAALGWRLVMGPVDVSTDDAALRPQLQDVFGRERVAFRQAHMACGDGMAVELFGFVDPPTSVRGRFRYAATGLWHICVVDPEIERRVERIVRLGGHKRTPVREIFAGEAFKFCYCEDPYGNAIEIATHPHLEAFGGRLSY